MKVSFQADNDFNKVILLGLARHEPAIDTQSAIAAGLIGRPDPEVLAIAAREGRILLTHDQQTMPVHFADFISSHASPGVFVVPQHLSPSVVTEKLLLIWVASEAEEWINRICYLPL